MTRTRTARKTPATWENRRIPSGFDLPVDTAMSRLRRVLARFRRRPVACPWEWERLASPEEIARLWAKTELRRAA